jgi:hypothetical protein
MLELRQVEGSWVVSRDGKDLARFEDPEDLDLESGKTERVDGLELAYRHLRRLIEERKG